MTSELTSIKVSDDTLQLLRKVKGQYMAKTGEQHTTEDILQTVLKKELEEVK